jgi:hypothetical protein
MLNTLNDIINYYSYYFLLILVCVVRYYISTQNVHPNVRAGVNIIRQTTVIAGTDRDNDPSVRPI